MNLSRQLRRDHQSNILLALVIALVLALTAPPSQAQEAHDARPALRRLSKAFTTWLRRPCLRWSLFRLKNESVAASSRLATTTRLISLARNSSNAFSGAASPNKDVDNSPASTDNKAGIGVHRLQERLHSHQPSRRGEADRIIVTLADDREFEAELIGADPKSDVAVIKIKGDDFPVLPIGDSDRLAVGEWVIAIGNPFGLTHTMTVGVVSAKGRSRMGITDYEDFIQTDAAINPGNSGGPLINLDGEVVGINTAIFSRSGGYMGIGFAIPIKMATHIQEQLVDTGKVTRGYLGVGIQDLTKDLATSFGLDDTDGVLVAHVAPGTPAKKAGIQSGDVIVKFDGHA